MTDFQVVTTVVVYDGTDEVEANRIYAECEERLLSSANVETSVMLLVDGDPVRECGGHAPHFPNP